MSACIVGWAHTPFGRLEAEDVESLLVQVARDAMADAGVDGTEIDAIVVGQFNAGFDEQEFPSSLILKADAGLRFKPATRVENACATGSAAIHLALSLLESRRARLVLVAGAEKMTGVTSARAGEILIKAAYVKEEGGIEAGFAGLFGTIADRYFQRYGDKSDALARIAAKNHRNGVGNPYAQMRKDLGFAFCNTVSERNPLVAGPLRRTDCSLISDGAAALVLADAETARAMVKAVAFRAAEQVNDLLPVSQRDIVAFEGPQMAWARALEAANVTLSDLSFVETHDCFTIAELIQYEAMGLTPPGQGDRAVEAGWTERDGRLPVNPSGGLKAKGHPIGATGVSMHVLSAMQLSNLAPDGIQLPSPNLAGVFNMGGAAVANYASVLERIR